MTRDDYLRDPVVAQVLSDGETDDRRWLTQQAAELESPVVVQVGASSDAAIASWAALAPAHFVVVDPNTSHARRALEQRVSAFLTYRGGRYTRVRSLGEGSRALDLLTGVLGERKPSVICMELEEPRLTDLQLSYLTMTGSDGLGLLHCPDNPIDDETLRDAWTKVCGLPPWVYAGCSTRPSLHVASITRE